jgi:hypothetical protein
MYTQPFFCQRGTSWGGREIATKVRLQVGKVYVHISCSNYLIILVLLCVLNFFPKCASDKPKKKQGRKFGRSGLILK